MQQIVLLNPAKVAWWIPQTIRMINSQPRNSSLGQEAKQEPMSVLKNRGDFYPDSGQIVNVKKAAVVNLLRGHFPGCRTVRLGVDQCIQKVETTRLSTNSVKHENCFFDGQAHIGTAPVQCGNPPLNNLLFAEPFFDPFWRYFGA